VKRSSRQTLASLEIRPEVLQAQQEAEELALFIQEASDQELKAFAADLMAFRERVGGYPLKDDGQAALAGDPMERHKAAALGYHALALMEVYKLRKLLEARK